MDHRHRKFLSKLVVSSSRAACPHERTVLKPSSQLVAGGSPLCSSRFYHVFQDLSSFPFFQLLGPDRTGPSLVSKELCGLSANSRGDHSHNMFSLGSRSP